MSQGAWRTTGQQVEVPGQVDRIPAFDSRSGDHLWAIITMFRWGGPEIEKHMLDQENLLSIAGPTCFYCEKPWSERLSKRRCTGEL